ncbi:signal peptidase I [Carboxydothermus ferrireducens]|uniref:Signal peptidase I n=1 Tax=Carboxydothermus ferrireducens DSM 11255 TaxID=1119529 RepID=A0ABX2R9I4_9THEO|nr:signal peptidase I [Carboxydothermus ferrireducens]NYE57217.1 signal peptidase I [Carboxydothermus ferrireducens DSM 11255]
MKKALAVFALWGLLTSNITFGYTVGSSMYPNIYNAVCVIEKVKPAEIKRGDIVSIKANDGEVVIKRVIGLPGEKIQIKNGRVYINGRVLNEPYLPKGTKTEWYFTDVLNIPKDSYFLLGDNREISKDSRHYGPVMAKNLEGKVIAYVNNITVGKIADIIGKQLHFANIP